MKKINLLLVILFALICQHHCIAQCTATSIATQPQNQNDSIPGHAHFSVSVSGTSPFNYYWYVNGVVVDSTVNSASATNTYNTPSLTMADSNNTYYCIITNCAGLNTVTSNTVHLICIPVSISIQPLSQTFTAGNVVTISFSVTVNGTPPFSYYWYAGSTLVQTTLDTIGHTSIYSFYANPVVFGMNGNTYHVVITNCRYGPLIGDCSQMTSNNAVLTVICPVMSAPAVYGPPDGSCTNGNGYINFWLSTPTVAGATYSWSCGTCNSSSQNPGVSFWATNACQSQFNYWLIINVNGCTSPPGFGSFFYSTPVSITNPIGDLSICSGDAVIYYPSWIGCGGMNNGIPHSATSCITGFANNLWYINDTLVNTGTTPCSVTYYVSPVSSSNCGIAMSSDFTVTVYPLPTVTVNSPSICSGQTAMLAATGATTYIWSAGASSTGVNTANASPSTSYTYTVTGTTNACSNTAISTVTVNSLPTITVNSPSICLGQTAILTANGGNTYVWSAGATPIGNDSATASPSATTTYTITGTDLNTCTNTAAVIVTVDPSVIITVNSPTICSGQTATLTANGATSYIWSGGATSTGVNTATVSPTSDTTYIVIGTNSCGTDTATAFVTVLNNLDNTVSSVGPLLTANQTGVSYQWLNCETGYLPITGATNQSYTITTNGQYAVVVSLGNCIDTSTCIPYYSVSVNSTINNHQSTITISPNPFTSATTIIFTESQKNTIIKITDVVGKKIKTINFTGNKCIIEKGEMKAGVYFVEIIDEENSRVNRKMIIQ